jgi:hypothetical protein
MPSTNTHKKTSTITIDISTTESLEMLLEDLKAAIAETRSAKGSISPRSMCSRMRSAEIEWQEQEKENNLTRTIIQLVAKLLCTHELNSLKKDSKEQRYDYEIIGTLKGTEA